MHKYNLRLFELFKEKLSDSEISKIIYDEYGIRLSATIIKRKRTATYFNKVQDVQKQELRNKAEKILNVLKLNRGIPQSAREISGTLKKEYALRLTKKEVNQILFGKLRNKIDYCRKTYRYTLKSNSPQLELEEPDRNKLLNDILESWKSEEVLSTFQIFFKEKYIRVKTGNDKLDYLIKSVVKDNIITKCEEKFLRQKAQELGVEQNLIDLAKKSLYSSNPYLDNLIHVIFEDGIITVEELQFLKEKSDEHNFSKSFVNRRFWTTGISVFYNHLRKIEGFDKFIVLFFLGYKLKSPFLNQEMWIFNNLNIFNADRIEEIIISANEKIEEEIINQIKKQFKVDPKLFLDSACRKIELEKIKINGALNQNKKLNGVGLEYTRLFRMLDKEKRIIGSPDANLLVENIKFQIENQLWD